MNTETEFVYGVIKETQRRWDQAKQIVTINERAKVPDLLKAWCFGVLEDYFTETNLQAVDWEELTETLILDAEQYGRGW